MKSMKLLTLLSVSLLIVSGCSNPGTTDTPSSNVNNKEPFYISTVAVDDLGSYYELKKTGKLQSSSEITVTAQLGGRVISLPKKLGDNVKQNDLVVELQDTAGSYSFAAEKANAAVTQVQISYEQTLLSLEKAIQDSQFGLQQAQNQAANASLASQSSAATTQLETAKQSFEKTKLDYENKLIADQQTIENYLTVGQNMYKDTQLLYETILTKTDQLLGVSDLRRYANDPYEHILGAKDTSTKRAAEDQLRTLFQEQKRLTMFRPTFNEYSLIPMLQDYLRYTRELRPFLDMVDKMLQNTITNTLYTENQLATDRATIDALQSQVSAQIASLTTQVNAIQGFFSTYQENQVSLAKAVDLAKTSYETAQANLETAQTNARVQVNSLANTLTTTEQNKITTEKALHNSIRQAQIVANEAGFQLSKLAAKAPIAGTIKDVFVDIGQEVSIGTPLFALSSTGDKQLEIVLTKQEVDTIEVGTEVMLTYEGKISTGVLSEIGTTPSVGISYKAIISTRAGDIPSGTLVEVMMPIHSPYIVIPLNWVRLVNTTQGKITLRDGKELHEEVISLGKLKGDQIEVTSLLASWTSLVTSDTKQFDPEKYDIVVKEENK